MKTNSTHKEDARIARAEGAMGNNTAKFEMTPKVIHPTADDYRAAFAAKYGA